MVKAITAYTAEIDDVETAVSEIAAQLDMSRNLRAHSVGFITCYTEFIETGVAKALSEALPFDVIGCTTAGTAVPGALGELLLSVLVLTSDDLLFAAGVSASLTHEQEAPLARAYQTARAKLPGEPAMMLLFAPLMRQTTGERIVEIINALHPGLPLFGALAVDYIDIVEFSKSYTLFNGSARRDVLSFALIYGDLGPRFFTAAISTVHIQKQNALITKAEGNRVMEINGLPALGYLKTLGMVGLSAGTNLSFPFAVDYQDGAKPVIRSLHGISQEGDVWFSGRMPVGATLSFGDMDRLDVLHTAGEIINTVKETKSSCILIFSCLTRYIVLGADTKAEMEHFRSGLERKRPYYFSYTGGEICPVYTTDGRMLNRFHNCSCIACVL
jgi:hypothetical protein